MSTDLIDNKIELYSWEPIWIIDSISGNVWFVRWNHGSHILSVERDINTYPKASAISVKDEGFLVLNPKIESHQKILSFSFNNPSRNIEIKLIENSHINNIDFKINREIIYYSGNDPDSPYYGQNSKKDFSIFIYFSNN